MRNSGATAVVEGVGANGCEYMTGGTVAILGAVGENFGAGMTGGMAFIYDAENRFDLMANADTITWRRIGSAFWDGLLRDMIGEHVERTGSTLGYEMLKDWEQPPRSLLANLPEGNADAPRAAAGRSAGRCSSGRGGIALRRSPGRRRRSGVHPSAASCPIHGPRLNACFARWPGSG
ncbi:MAG: hypothetical protein WDM79_12385 [Terricaulis sp.]